jgi:MFS family permease
MDEMISAFHLPESTLGHLTSAVQLGFIFGTLLFALLAIADRFSPSKVFFFSALLGGLFNLGLMWEVNGLGSLLVFRFFTGFCLAGIYPVGMKIAADYFEKGLGVSLGYLVGALVLGTAFPHLLKELAVDLPWSSVIVGTSTLALMGGLLLFTLVPDGPYRQAAQRVDLKSAFQVFKNRPFRAAAFGYFGHMWELYALWAFIPYIITQFNDYFPDLGLPVSLLSCIVIGVGGFSCVIAGYLGRWLSEKKVALTALALSGLCCLAFPFLFYNAHPVNFLLFLVFWGMVVIADSPLFSSLVARNAPAEMRGSALTLVNSLGFAISIASIQLLNSLSEQYTLVYFIMVLAAGPLLGLIGSQFNSRELR